ncbi:MAG: Asp-tRNA(Asn)/Glu-tRNA(Gln) amidotransferase subunit GatB [Gammaproteobacteria bacterium]|nr:Asp-tRNA(Asn)/Glu-tRNA(Gln) amidotransferase subunit GatB [Gammaproteobacteria bacterium]MDG1951915.1 Asp-tRNA(Asn)/Glu-tRNA(Gln) amidotransferase subunit GatB [Gammaproteobacteria bacterium]
MTWETVIGLEVHVQLSTKSKLFSGSDITFGAEPNTQANIFDLALPGTLPVFNESVLKMAVKFGLAIDAQINKKSVFDRKNYFYPDLPKGYQVSQLDHPTVGPGSLEIKLENGSEKTININRAHIEEDAGKSLHEDYQGMSGIDLNRAGTPLLEIVSEPDLRSAEEAVSYLKKLHTVIRYLDISDAIMAEGSMRCDANISVRKTGETELGTRTEIKNINSFRFVERAINHEARRQIELIEDGGSIAQETRLYDSELDETRPMRSKEIANDYRYFPEPDLLPVIIDDAYIDAVRDELPELPEEKKQRFISQLKLSEYDASVLVANREIADFFEKVAIATKDSKAAANWVSQDMMALLNKNNCSILETTISVERLSKLILRVKDGTISGKIAKSVFDLMVSDSSNVDAIIKEKGLEQVSDTNVIDRLVDEVIAANPSQVEQYRAGKEQVIGFLVGQCMQRSKGKANPSQVNSLLKEKLS